MQAMAPPAVKRQTLAQQGLEWVGSARRPNSRPSWPPKDGRWNELVIAQKLSFG